MTGFEDRLAELERRAGINDGTRQVFEVPAPEPVRVPALTDAEVRELHELKDRLPASILRMALTSYINRDPADFATLVKRASLADRYPANGYATGGLGPERPETRTRPCPKCGAKPGQQCRRLSGNAPQFLKAPHRERSGR